MKNPRRRNLLIAGLVAVVGIAGYLGLQSINRGVAAGQPLVASGTIEARQVNIAAELSGRIAQIGPDQGQPVKAGDILIQLDASALQAQLEQAKSAVLTAQANYDLLAAKPTSEQLRVAQAAVDVAQANVDRTKASARTDDLAAAQAALDAANAAYARATDKNLKYADTAAAQAALNAAEENYKKLKAGPTDEDVANVRAALQNADAALRQAQSAYDNAYRQRPAGIGANPASLALEVATNNYNSAKSQYDKVAKGADAAQLSAGLQAVQAAQSQLSRVINEAADAANIAAARQQVLSAQANLERVKNPARDFDNSQALAQLDQARAQLDALKVGPRPEQLAVAKAQISAAQAQAKIVEVQIAKLTIKSPIDGVVLARSVEAGEIVAPGGTLYQIGRVDGLQVTVFLPEEQIGLVTPGQRVALKVDAYRDRTFEAAVLTVADRAEFTPRNVQTAEGRKDTVFAVRLSVDNTDLALKPGMPADVTFPRR